MECYNKIRDYIFNQISILHLGFHTTVILNHKSNHTPFLLLNLYGYLNPASMPINLSTIMAPNQPMSSMEE